MARKRTHRKSKFKKNLPGITSSALSQSRFKVPTRREWEEMEGLSECKIVGTDRNIYEIKPRDEIRVLGGSMSLTGDNELHTYWIARVAAIHAREPWNVWLQVQWYYSGPDIEKEDPEHTSYFGRYERALSDTWDIIHWESVDGHATVVNFDSSSLEQEPIDEGAFYYRWNWSRANKTLNGPSRSPSTSCIGTCEELYNPDGNSPMHLCPRPSCRRWFHRICLFTTNCTIRRSAAEHADLLLRSSPDSDEDFSLFKPSKPAAARMTASRRNKGKGKENCLPLDDLPSPLRRCAQKAIVRGGEYGVAGNVHAVVQARRLVYQIFKNEPDSQKDLDKWMEGREGDVDTEDSEQDEYGEYYICPNCKGAI